MKGEEKGLTEGFTPKHELIPKHVLLSKDEARQLLEAWKIKPYQLPRIRAADPVAKSLKTKPGDIIKIIRKSETAGESVYYRYVVEEG